MNRATEYSAGQIIRFFREREGLTQEELADIGHFQKDEVSKLFQIISVGNAVIPEGITQAPDLGD